MKITRRALATLLATLLLLCPVIAQTQSPTGQAAVPLVTATASSLRVRYVSMGEVNQTRLQVFSADGTQVFDSDFKLGNLIDWQLSDSQGSRLIDGSYLFLVSVKDFSGTLTQKYGTATLEQAQVYLQQTARDELPQAQAAALDSNKLSAVLTSIDRIGVAAVTQSTTASTDGATTIDTVTSTGKTAAKAKTSGGNKIAGTGTQNRLAKWTDSSATLGDSVLLDTGTALQLTAAPSSQRETNLFYLNTTDGTTGISAGAVPSFGANNGPYFAMRGNTFPIYSGQRGLFAISAGNPSSPSGREGGIIFNTGNDQTRMIVSSSGNVGIGTTTPSNTLDVNGGVQMTPGGSGGKIQFGTPNAETGMTISGTNRADVRFDGSTLKLLAGTGVTSPANGVAIDTAGNVGIGTFAPQNKLVVNAGGSGGGLIQFGTPNSETGMTISGTNRADVRFDGQTLKLLAGAGTGTMAATNGININTVGNVGIGTTTPTAAKLQVSDTSSGVFTGVYGTSTNGSGVIGESASAGGWGVYGRNNAGGYAVYAEGNAGQSRDRGGFVKAMAFVNEDGTIARCYNGITGATTGNCGFQVTHTTPTIYLVNLGFKVDDRFFSITGFLASSGFGSVGSVESSAGNVVTVHMFNAFNSGDQDAPFMIIIY